MNKIKLMKKKMNRMWDGKKDKNIFKNFPASLPSSLQVQSDKLGYIFEFAAELTRNWYRNSWN
jgi:hypothetical protein